MAIKKSSEEAREPSSAAVKVPVVGAKTHHGHRSAPWARSKS
jgi:hypothetical protein